MSYTHRQLYVDGRMVGPSHGSHVAGPHLPDSDDYSLTARIDRDGVTVAELRRVDGREQYRCRGLYGVGLTLWVWRDSTTTVEHSVRVGESVVDGREVVLT